MKESSQSINVDRMVRPVRGRHLKKVSSSARRTVTSSSTNHYFLPSTNRSSRRVTVVGGRGVMGRFFVQQLSAAGHRVNVLEQENWSQARQILDGADLALICVPIECTPTRFSAKQQ
jgi:hypothetical protein